MGKNKTTRALFLEKQAEDKQQGPVKCLGMTFENEEVRREYFLKKLKEGLEELHEKLSGVKFTTVDDAVEKMKSIEKWPMGDEERLKDIAENMRDAHRKEPDKDLLQLWKDEIGFPHGEIEDIINLSDPPYYTACPNPFLADFIKHYGKPYDPETDDYRREPFASDVSEGKYDPLYKIHAYPTKVPFRAIIRYLLHFTRPGDLVFDGFAGTGMTGVAAEMCANYEEVNSFITTKKDFLKGHRFAVLCDLSTNATHIASNYVRQINVVEFKKYFFEYIAKCEAQISWLYETREPSTGKTGTINYVVWSEVFFCEHCSHEYSYWDSAVIYKPGDTLGKVNNKQICPYCGAEATRRTAQNAVEMVFDPIIGKTIARKKHVPVLINYRLDKTRLEKEPDDYDLALLRKISENLPKVVNLIRTAPLMHRNEDFWGDLQREYHFGISHTHHFFSPRNLQALAILNKELSSVPRPYRDAFRFLVTASFNRITNLVRYMPQYKERNVGPLSGTLYKPMLFGELNILNVLKAKINRAVDGISKLPDNRSCVITTQSSSFLQAQIPDNIIDYIFTDPPFGDNLPYSELNFNEETWLGVQTNMKPEAIVSNIQQKDVRSYQKLIGQCFSENYRILKPGRWMTVVFHNSHNSIWNAIQEALFEAGFVIADVRTLDKKRGTTKQQVYTSGAVKQDLVISAYKPNGGLEERFKLTAGTEEGVWDFVHTHLKKLPIFVSQKGKAEIIAERQNYLLYDRMVAFHVQRGVTVPLSAAEFYAGLAQRFPERDGMYFLPEQVAEYDKKRMKSGGVVELSLLIMDEESAIQWLRQELKKKPQTFQEIHPKFIKKLGTWKKFEKPLELLEILEENFLKYDGKGEVPSQIHSYLSTNYKELRNLPKDDPKLKAKAKDRWYVPNPNKAADLEKLRERTLLREFKEYVESKKKRLKVFRLEAVRAGFKKAWQEKDYATIVSVARKIPEKVLQEDPKLLMWYDQAVTRIGEYE